MRGKAPHRGELSCGKSFEMNEPFGPPPPPAPRPVPREAVDWKAKIAVMAGMMWMAMSMVMIVVFARDGSPLDDQILDDHGEKVKATPTEVVETNTTQNKRQLYEIHLEFEDVDGVARKVTMTSTDMAKVNAARDKSPLAIEYDPSDIERVRWEGQYYASMPTLAFYGLGGAFVLGFCIVLVGVALAMRARGLYRNGDVCRGVVTTVRELKANQKTLYAFEYRYETSKGSDTGKWRTKPGAPAPAEQQAIWVIYDRRHHDRSVPVVHA